MRRDCSDTPVVVGIRGRGGSDLDDENPRENWRHGHFQLWLPRLLPAGRSLRRRVGRRLVSDHEPRWRGPGRRRAGDLARPRNDVRLHRGGDRRVSADRRARLDRPGTRARRAARPAGHALDPRPARLLVLGLAAARVGRGRRPCLPAGAGCGTAARLARPKCLAPYRLRWFPWLIIFQQLVDSPRFSRRNLGRPGTGTAACHRDGCVADHVDRRARRAELHPERAAPARRGDEPPDLAMARPFSGRRDRRICGCRDLPAGRPGGRPGRPCRRPVARRPAGRLAAALDPGRAVVVDPASRVCLADRRARRQGAGGADRLAARRIGAACAFRRRDRHHDDRGDDPRRARSYRPAAGRAEGRWSRSTCC